MDIDESELDVDEGVELVDSAGLPIREKMVYMSVGDAHQTQDDISECCTHSATEILPFDLLTYCAALSWGLTHLGQSCKLSCLFLSLADTASLMHAVSAVTSLSPQYTRRTTDLLYKGYIRYFRKW